MRNPTYILSILMTLSLGCGQSSDNIEDNTGVECYYDPACNCDPNGSGYIGSTACGDPSTPTELSAKFS